MKNADQGPSTMNADRAPAQRQPVGTGGEHTRLPYGITLSSDMAVMHSERDLQFLGLDHLAIRVSDVRRAEDFYREFFQMDVVLRARYQHERWDVLPSTYDYQEGHASGYFPEIVQLRNGALTLVLINAGRGSVLSEPRVAHIGLRVPGETLSAIKAVALIRNFTVEQDERDAFRFTDPFGQTWHLTTGEGQG